MYDRPVTEQAMDLATAQRLIDEKFAPWIQSLNVRIEAMSPEGVTMRLPHSDALCRADRIISGQALMAVIDTCAVFVVWGQQNEPRNTTTVTQTTNFMRPAIGQDVIAKGRAMKAGRTMVFIEVSLYGADDGKLIAQGTSTFAILPGNLPSS